MPLTCLSVYSNACLSMPELRWPWSPKHSTTFKETWHCCWQSCGSWNVEMLLECNFSKMCFFWNVVVFCQMLFYFFKMLLCFLKCCIWRNVFSCNATVLCEMLLFLLSCVLTLKATVLNTCLCSSAPHLSAKQFVSVAVYMCRRLTCESDNIFTSFCSWHAERHVVISYGQKTEWLGCS